MISATIIATTALKESFRDFLVRLQKSILLSCNQCKCLKKKKMIRLHELLPLCTATVTVLCTASVAVTPKLHGICCALVCCVPVCPLKVVTRLQLSCSSFRMVT